MNWFKKALDVVAGLNGKFLAAIASIGGIAGVVAGVAAIPGIGIPAAVGVIATKVLVVSGTAAVIAAKAMPGHGGNAPAP
jgi:hypothetical protein